MTDPQTAMLAGAGALVLGCVGLMMGYRVFRGFLTLTGAVLGGLIAVLLVPNAGPTTQVVVAGFGALALGSAAYSLYRLVFYTAGGAMGVVVGLAIGYLAEVPQSMMLTLGLVGLPLGVLAGVLLEKPVIIINASVLGASYLLGGLHLLLPDVGLLTRTDGQTPLLALAAWGVLALLGTLYQSRRDAGRRE